MTRRYLTTARGIFDLLGKVPSAARVASALEKGLKPDRRDLQSLGIDDIFSTK
ncbi:hypothetical protein [Hoeflea sp. TYP-13]|uniref:hypothetical protein n=1 Tax=Hoeflea sp. TYP-13 TaxID=3230023 RepID=UPI0034C68EA6